VTGGGQDAAATEAGDGGPGRPWPIVDFLLRLRADEAAGRTRPLRDYLAEFPAHEAEVAAEYLQVRALDRAAASAGAPRAFGRFRLERELGRGGEGTVFLAHEPLLARYVALKVRHGVALSELDEARLVRAAAMAARLDHPCLCRVYGAGREGNALWVAMQYVEGQTLADELADRRRRGDPMPAPTAATLIASLAGALQHAHERDVVHRDVKPGNVLLGCDGVPRLTDFGLAFDAANARDLTLTGELRGTPAYMAPEQLDGARVDARADGWALGVLLFESVTLQHPFAAASQAAVARTIAERPVWTHAAWARLGADLRAVLATALAPSPDQRYASAAAFAADLLRLAAGQPVAVRAPGPARRMVAWARRERAAAAGLALAAMALVIGPSAALWAWQGERLARSAAEARAGRVREVARSILFDMDDALVAGHGNVALRRRLLARAKDGLATLCVDAPHDVQLRRELALAWMRLGDACGHDSVGNGGDLEEATRCFAAAAEVARAVPEAGPRGVELRAAVAFKQADLALARGADAGRRYREVVSLTGTSTVPGLRRLRALATAQLAQIERDARRAPDALRLIEAAEAELVGGPAAGEAPAGAVDLALDRALDLALVRDTKATILAEAGDAAAAVTLLQSVLADLAAMAHASDDAARLAQVRSGLQQHRGQCLILIGETDAGLACLDEVVGFWRARLAADATDGGAGRRLAMALEERGRAHASLGHGQCAAADFGEALTLAEAWKQTAAAARLRRVVDASAR